MITSTKGTERNKMYKVLKDIHGDSPQVIGKAKNLKEAKRMIENARGEELGKLIKREGYWELAGCGVEK